MFKIYIDSLFVLSSSLFRREKKQNRLQSSSGCVTGGAGATVAMVTILGRKPLRTAMRDERQTNKMAARLNRRLGAVGPLWVFFRQKEAGKEQTKTSASAVFCTQTQARQRRAAAVNLFQ